MSKPVAVSIPANTATQVTATINLGASKQLHIWCEGGPIYFGTDNTVSASTGYPALNTETVVQLNGLLGLGVTAYNLWAYFDSPDPIAFPSMNVKIWSP